MFIFGGPPLLWAEPMRSTDCKPSQSDVRNVTQYIQNNIYCNEGSMTKIQVFTLVFLAMDRRFQGGWVAMKKKRQIDVSRGKLSMDAPSQYFILTYMYAEINKLKYLL